MRRADWELWIDMARESANVATDAEADGFLRSALSRYYYAAYQAATALLLYRGLTPPDAREAWSHAETPELMVEHLRPLIRSRDKRKDLARRLRVLYLLRITADYEGRVSVTDNDVTAARRDAGYILKVVGEVLPQTGGLP